MAESINELKVLEYELKHVTEKLTSIKLVRVRGINCERWEIRAFDHLVLGKHPHEDGQFYFSIDPLPSSRDDHFFKEYRWNAAEKAYKFWMKNKNKIRWM